MTTTWKFQNQTFGAVNASTFRKLMARKELSASELVAREIIQNSEDAAQRFRKELKREDIPFRMEFTFRRLEGKAKKQFLEVTGVDGIIRYALRVGPKALDVKPGLDLKALLSDRPLEILEMSDYGARGLRGSPTKVDQSAYYNCLLTIGQSEDKESGAGGSYGFGKSAFINGSQLGLVLAYSCFEGSEPQDDATRRFGGVAYWNDHVCPDSNVKRTGLAAFGDPSRAFEWIDLPFEDEAADRYAQATGLMVRDPAELAEHGTSLLVICPAVDTNDLVEAIESYWWPALIGAKPRVQVKITDFDGATRMIAPKQNQRLKPFIRAYELATTSSEPNDNFEFKKTIVGPDGSRSVGTFAAVADPKTCFDPKRANGSQKESLVALIRAPRMVVKYEDYGKGPASAPFIEGVFVSADDDGVEDLLRKSEPPTHDYWWPKPQVLKELKRTEPELHRLLDSIKSGLRSAVNSFKAAIKPRSIKEKTGLKNFGKFLSKIMTDAGPGGAPKVEADPFRINFRLPPTPAVASSNRIKYATEVAVRIKDTAKKDTYKIKVMFEYREVVEEDGKGEVVGHSVQVLSAPKEFGKTGEGTIRKGEEVVIRFTSSEIDADKSISGQCRVRVRAASKSGDAE